MVEMDNGHGLESCEVPINQLKIAARSLSKGWADRLIEATSIIPSIQPKAPKLTPAQSKSSVKPAPSSSSIPKLFAKAGLLITLGPNNDNWHEDKGKLLNTVSRNGGIAVDDWCQLFNLEGKLSGGSRWILKKEEVTLLRDDVDRVFLLSDEFNRKPKYLMALALGIPCLSITWLHACDQAQEEKDWQPYLLPGGFCERLNARLSQLVDCDWGASPDHLEDIMGNPVPPKIFAGNTILCISPDFVPASKASRRNNTDLEKAYEASRMVPRIILCMGADCVEAVAEIAKASKALSERQLG